MTVTVTGVVKTVAGVPDRSKWVFASLLRESGDVDNLIVSPNLVVATPNTAGLLTVELDPGPVIVRYGNTNVTVDVPDTGGEIDLWRDLMAVAVSLPPATSDEKLAAAVTAYLDAHPGGAVLELGTTGTTAAAGNDARLSDARPPTDGSVTTAKIVDGSVTTSKIVDANVTSAKLSSAVQTSLGKADTAYQAPAVVGAGTTQAAARTAISAVGRNELVFNVKDYGAVGNGSTDDSTAVTAAISAAVTARGGTYSGSAAFMRSVVFFPPGTYLFGAQTLTDGVYIDGLSARIRPTAGFTGIWITVSGRFAGLGRGVWLQGNNVSGEIGIKVTSASFHAVIDCSMDNWAGKCIRTEGFSTHVKSEYVSGMNNTTYINGLSAGSYVGVVEMAGSDGSIGDVEINAARTSGGSSVAASTNRVVAALLVSGGENRVTGSICEQADIGIYNTGFYNKYKNVRVEFNTTHGFWASAGSGEIVGCQALGDSRLADNTYDGFFIDTPGGWIFDDNISRSDNPGDSIKHRSGLNCVQGNIALGKFISTGGDHKAYQVPVIARNINPQTGTTYTFVDDDNDRVVTFSNASAVTATVPLYGSIPWPIGTVLDVVNLGAGQVTVTGGVGGATINGAPGTKLDQYKGARLLKTDYNTWVITGQLSA